MGKGLDLLGVAKAVSPLLTIKNITHQHGLCGAIVAGASFFTLPLGEFEMITHIKNRGETPFLLYTWVLVVRSTGIIPSSSYLDTFMSL